MADFMHWVKLRFLTNWLFFFIPLLYYYANINLSIICYLFWRICIIIHTYFLGTNLNSSIIFFLSSGDIYLFLGVAFSTSSISLFGNSLKCDFVVGFFATLVILSAILLPMKSPVASAFFELLFLMLFLSYLL